jgi:hypothetical protein
MKHLLFFYSIFLTPFLAAQNTHILFGERDLTNTANAIFLDKEGSPYPNYFIANDALDSCNASLLNWYAIHQTDFIRVSKQYNCSFNNYNEANGFILNDSIISFIKKNIDAKKTSFASVSFLIHGYRKPFVKTNSDRTSLEDFATLEETINKTIQTLYVEVYWDAMYDCCYSTNTKKNKLLYHLLEEAEKNALPVGKSLRKVMYDLRFDTINVITHSLGAKVAIHALYDEDDYKFPTPIANRINICLIAPALSGVESFKNYYNRQTNIQFKTTDNYKLGILYNEHDFVLRKKVSGFGPGPYKYVNTTLGCNYKGAAFDLKKYFEKHFENAPIKLIDGSNGGPCHLVICYCNSGNVEELMEWMKK